MVAEQWNARWPEMPREQVYDGETMRKIQDLESLGAILSSGMPPEVVDRIHAYEFGPRTTDLDELKAAGVRVPPTDSLSDTALSGALRRVIDGLARLGVFLTGTDHLSDRDLYRQLEEEILRTPHGPTDKHHGWTIIDLMGGEGEGVEVEDSLESEAEAPRFDRDRTLPTPQQPERRRGKGGV